MNIMFVILHFSVCQNIPSVKLNGNVQLRKQDVNGVIRSRKSKGQQYNDQRGYGFGA